MEVIKSHAGLRGFAAVCVMLFHYRSALNGELDIDKITGFFSGSGAFVDLFFMLSGFIMAACYGANFQNGIASQNYKTFMLRRFARIYPLHLATLLAMVCLALYRAPGELITLSPDIVKNLLLVHAWGLSDVYVLNFPSWSISAEWLLYLLFPFLAWGFATYKGKTIILLISGVIYLALFALGNGFEVDERFSMARALPAFTIGLLLFSARSLITQCSAQVLSILQLIAAGGTFLCLHFEWPRFFLVPLFALLVFTTFRDQGVVARILGTRRMVFLGDISYSIYMLHIPVRTIMNYVWGKFFADLLEPINGLLFLSSCVALTLALSAVSYRYFEMPMRRWINSASLRTHRHTWS